MLANLRVNWVILRTCIEERLVYRADFAFATLVRFLPIVTQIFLWGAIFASATDASINGYTYANMVTYYLLAMLARAFSSMPGLASGIARDVRDGTIKKYLTQPIDMLGYLFWHRVAHKLVYYVVAAGPFLLVFWLCGDYFPDWPPAWTWLAFLASLVMAFLVGFLIESLIGLIAFWFLEVSSLLFIYMMMNFFLSGHMLPLDWLPERLVVVSVEEGLLYPDFGDGSEVPEGWGLPCRPAIDLLPFKYLAYVPPAIFLQRDGYDSPRAVGWALLIQAAWIVVLFGLNRFAFARGVKRYSAFGG